MRTDKYGHEVDEFGNPTVYKKQSKRNYHSYAAKYQVDPNLSPPSRLGLDVLQELRDIKVDRAIVEGNRLFTHDRTLYVPKSTAQALLRRRMVDIWEEPDSFVQHEYIAINNNGLAWLKEHGPKPKKKLSKAQQKREVDHLLDVLRSSD